MKTFRNTTGICLFILGFFFLFATKAKAQTTNQKNPIKAEAGIRFIPVFTSFDMRPSTGTKLTENQMKIMEVLYL